MVKVLGAGTLLAVEEPAGGGTYTDLGCVVDITPPGVEYENVEAELCLGDLVSTTPESSPGDPQVDEVTFTSFFEPGSVEDNLLRDVAASRASRLWRITYPNSDTDFFAGYMRRYKPQTIARKEYMKAEGVVVRTGAITKS